MQTHHNFFQRLLTLPVTMLLAVPTFAQGLRSAYFTDGYLYQHTLNPAMGNDQNYVALPALGNINAETHGNFGYEDLVRDNPLYPTESDKRRRLSSTPISVTRSRASTRIGTASGPTCR